MVWSCLQILPPPQGFLHGLNLSGFHACLAAPVRWILRVSGSGMKIRCASAPVPAEPLKPVRHGKIERMNARWHGVEQKATPINREQAKGTKKEIPGLCLLRSLL